MAIERIEKRLFLPCEQAYLNFNKNSGSSSIGVGIGSEMECYKVFSRGRGNCRGSKLSASAYLLSIKIPAIIAVLCFLASCNSQPYQPSASYQRITNEYQPAPAANNNGTRYRTIIIPEGSLNGEQPARIILKPQAGANGNVKGGSVAIQSDKPYVTKEGNGDMQIIIPLDNDSSYTAPKMGGLDENDRASHDGG